MFKIFTDFYPYYNQMIEATLLAIKKLIILNFEITRIKNMLIDLKSNKFFNVLFTKSSTTHT